VVGHILRRIAREAGVGRIGVRVRSESDVHRLVVAYPWAHEGSGPGAGAGDRRGRDAFGAADDLVGLVTEVAGKVRDAPAGDPPLRRSGTAQPHVPGCEFRDLNFF
jgi:cyanophycin synthetase